MFKRFALSTFAILVAATFSCAQQPLVTVPVTKAPASDGKAMFTNYCAPCHGVDGKGSGPVTSQLVQKPVDLTMLQKNNGGKFPSAHLVAIIQFGPEVPAAHGTKDMPIWGPILGKMDNGGNNQTVQNLRISNLENYIRSIQAK